MQALLAKGMPSFQDAVRSMKSDARSALPEKLRAIIKGNATDAIKARAEKALESWGKSEAPAPDATKTTTPLSGKLNAPIFEKRKPASAEDQALVEKLNADGRGVDGRGKAVAQANQDAHTERADRVAAAFGKRVVWVEGLAGDGFNHPGIDRSVIFLDPDSKRPVQVLIAHEIAHSLQRENPFGYKELLDNIRSAIDPEAWKEFVKRAQKAETDAGGKALSDAQLRNEFTANLIADHAVQQHAEAVRRENAERGGEYKGYSSYLKPEGREVASAAISAFLRDSGHSDHSFYNAQSPKDEARTPATKEEQEKFHADTVRRLGPQITTALHESLTGTGAKGKPVEVSGHWTRGAIHASLYARNLGQVGAHEAFHEFFSRLSEAGPAAAKVVDILSRAADSEYVTRQLERMLDGDKNALAQIKKGAPNYLEERMAYMFQFHQAAPPRRPPPAGACQSAWPGPANPGRRGSRARGACVFPAAA